MAVKMSDTGVETGVLCAVAIPFRDIAPAVAARFESVIGRPMALQIARADQIATPAPGTRVVIFYPGLQAALNSALAAGTPPEAALTEWQAMAEGLLAFYRLHRKTAFLAETGTLVQDPAGLRERLAGWAGPLPDVGAIATNSDPTDEDTDRTAQLASIMTAVVLMASRDLRRMTDELGAAGFALPVPVPDAGSLLQVTAHLWRQLETQVGTLKRQAERDAGRADDLQKQILSLQETLEQEYNAQKVLRASVAGFNSIEKPQYERRIAERDKKIAAQRSEIELMHAEIARFYKSLSWKVTGPMRAIRRGFDSVRKRKG